MKRAGVVYIGIDVSKETLDIDAGDLGTMKISNEPAEIRKALRGFIRKAGGGPLQACLESTGPYIRDLVAQCRAAGLPCSVLNPYKVACFAKSVAQAKTDRIDAALIRRYAEVRRPAPSREPPKAAIALDKLVQARARLARSLAELECAIEYMDCPVVRKVQGRTVKFLGKQVAECDRLIAEAAEADAEVGGLVGALDAVTGMGTLTAATIVGAMPEIGTLGRRRVASLAGLAPRTRESGKWKGKARIGGGRKQVRDALFMPATVAIRHDPVMRRLHEREIAKGKPYKVAITAAMRRLLCHLESVAKSYRAKHSEEASA